MEEPFLSEFRELVARGAAAQDIHDVDESEGFAASNGSASETFLAREIGRVALHQRSLCPLLEESVGPVKSALDVGCSTGGTTVAIALSQVLKPELAIGVDPNVVSIEAAKVRALGHGLSPERVRFEPIVAGQALPFAANTFDLTTCVSVLEFVTNPGTRRSFIAEIVRVTKVGGYIFLATPSPFRLREYHSRRLFGDWRRKKGFPWSSPPWEIRRMLAGCGVLPTAKSEIRRRLSQRAPRLANALVPLSPILTSLMPWQRVLVRKFRSN